MPQLSIKTRLNLLIGALLVLALCANVLVIIWSAGPRIKAEDDSIIGLTRQTVDRALAELQSSPDPARDLANLLDRLSGVRHAQVSLERPDGSTTNPPVVKPRPKVPSWFAGLVYLDRQPLRVTAKLGTTHLGTLVIASNPGDEIAEIWDAVFETLTSGLVLIGVVYALTSLAVRHALMPVQNLGRALRLMQGGDYRVELARTGPPELAEISGKLNELAAVLDRTRGDNSRLAEQMISVQDHERRELARELHDEFGPYLFAIRANVTALLSEAERAATPDAALRAQTCTKTLDQIRALQQLNRGVLQRLRPPALSELGLDGALRGLIAQGREHHQGVAITLDDATIPDGIDDTSQLTIYRVVQEGLTNALRHANATRVEIAIGVASPSQLTVTVTDNGTGLSGNLKPGFGLSGMSERVWALGGTLSVTPEPNGGVVLCATLPLPALAHTQPPPATRGLVAPAAQNAHVSGQTVAPDRA